MLIFANYLDVDLSNMKIDVVSFNFIVDVWRNKVLLVPYLSVRNSVCKVSNVVGL